MRNRISLKESWRFYKYESASQADDLIYDVRPEVSENIDNRAADAKPTEAVTVEAVQQVLKPWILPTGNSFIDDSGKHHVRPEGNPGEDFPFVQADFDDIGWENVNLPHDWAIQGPFYEGPDAPVGGSMGRLPSPGVAWYRRKLTIPEVGKSVFLDVDGAMSYAMVWVNGTLVGGWPYGYASWRLDLTPFVVPGDENQIAIRLDNPPDSSRWYPGGGIYRNVWLTTTAPVHVGHWGTRVTTPEVSLSSATVAMEVSVDNNSPVDAVVSVSTSIYALDSEGRQTGEAVAQIAPVEVTVSAGQSTTVNGAVTLADPKLWGPPPTQQANRYVAVTTVLQHGKPIDSYGTAFGFRSVDFDPDNGILVNGERIPIRGVNLHHDLGPLGALLISVLPSVNWKCCRRWAVTRSE